MKRLFVVPFLFLSLAWAEPPSWVPLEKGSSIFYDANSIQKDAKDKNIRYVDVSLNLPLPEGDASRDELIRLYGTKPMSFFERIAINCSSNTSARISSGIAYGKNISMRQNKEGMLYFKLAEDELIEYKKSRQIDYEKMTGEEFLFLDKVCVDTVL